MDLDYDNFVRLMLILRFVKPDDNQNYDPKTSPTQN